MPTLKCQTFLNNLHQKKYHYFKDEDIIRIMINTDEEEWYALTHSKKLLQFYLDNPNSGIPYDKSLLNDEAMMGHYDSLYYRIAKNRSRMLTLSPLIFENIHYTGEIKRIDRKTQVENLMKYYQGTYSSDDIEEKSIFKNDEVLTFDFSLAIESLKLPAIVTTANPQGMCFLIDTGSNDNVLCDYVHDQLKDQVRDLDEKNNFYGVDGQKQIVSRASMTLNICGQDYDADFNVADVKGFDRIEQETGVQLHGILGIDFLIKNKWVLDFANQQVIIPKKVA